MNVIYMPQFKRAYKKLKKMHQDEIIKDLDDAIRKLINLEITTQKSNHELTNSKLNDLHIRPNIILLYRYSGQALVLTLELHNIVNHDELNRKLKENKMKFLKEDIQYKETQIDDFVYLLEHGFNPFYEVKLRLEDGRESRYFFRFESDARDYYEGLLEEANKDLTYYEGSNITLTKINLERNEEELEDKNIDYETPEDEEVIEEE